MTTDFSEKEQEVLVLEIVDACIQYSKEHGETFQQVLEAINANKHMILRI